MLMKTPSKVPAAALIIVALALTQVTVANAVVITFDELPAMNNNLPLTSAYAGVGVTFDNRNSGIWGGLAEGDPGNWQVNGTSGPQFLGNNGQNNNSTYAQSIFFATPQFFIYFDATRTEGSGAGQTLTANAYDSLNDLVATETLVLGNVNAWSTFTLNAANIVRVDTVGSAQGYSPYAIDNLNYNTVPEPSTLALAGIIGLSPILCRRQRR